MRIAMMGTRGVPARYGGFETCVEEVGSRLAAAGHDVTVYCRGIRKDAAEEYLGMRLVHLPALRLRAAETLSHSALSVAHLMGRSTDAALLFNAGNAPLLPALRARGVPVATHVDGLEWKRAKWAGVGRHYYRVAEALAVRWSDALIADAQGIADYYEKQFGAPTTLITYGAPLVARTERHRLAELGLSQGGFHLAVARMEPENNVDVVVDGYVRSGARRPLVLVGSAPYAEEYAARVRALADDRVVLLGSLWDQELLDQLYAGALTYLHGHSVGGTNPSLLRAVGAGAATNAFDVSFNREVLLDEGRYWRDAAGVGELVDAAEADPEATMARGERTRRRAVGYDWDDVARRYEQLCKRLEAGDVPSYRPSGRRRTVPAGSPVAELPELPGLHEVPQEHEREVDAVEVSAAGVEAARSTSAGAPAAPSPQRPPCRASEQYDQALRAVPLLEPARPSSRD